MKKNILIKLAVFAIAFSFFAAGSVFAGNPADGVDLKYSAKHKDYTKKPKDLLPFNHSTHTEQGCADCHHDDREGLGKVGAPPQKAGDTALKCYSCHSNPGELKGKKAKGKTDLEKIKYYGNAMHKNCKDCHKALKQPEKAPYKKCSDCHPKKKK